MRLLLDKYANLASPIHRWYQPSKIIGLFSLILAFAFVEHLLLLPIMVLITILLYWLSKLPFHFLINRLRYPGLFIVGVVFFLPFFAGDTIIFSWGFLTIRQEGCYQVLLIITRFFSILSVSLVLFGTSPFLTTIKAMKTLGISKIIIDMALLTYRYLEELATMLITMQRATQLRGFQPKTFKMYNLKVLAQLMGSLLIRSYERSQRVYHAMILRGYGYQTSQIKRQKIDNLSLCFLSISILLSMGLIGSELLL